MIGKEISMKLQIDPKTFLFIYIFQASVYVWCDKMCGLIDEAHEALHLKK